MISSHSASASSERVEYPVFLQAQTPQVIKDVRIVFILTQ